MQEVAANKHLGDSADRLVAAREELPPIEDIGAWIERLLRYLGDSISHIWASARDFVPRVFGCILSGLKAAAEWAIQALAHLVEWLRRVFSSLGPLVLGIAIWIAVAFIVSRLFICLLELYEASKRDRLLLPGPNASGHRYGTFDTRVQRGVNGESTNIRTTFYHTRGPAYRPNLASDDVSRPVPLVLSFRFLTAS
ncbi:hypothetical protein PG988_005225 [Apiospora saccharicola]